MGAKTTQPNVRNIHQFFFDMVYELYVPDLGVMPSVGMLRSF